MRHKRVISMLLTVMALIGGGVVAGATPAHAWSCSQYRYKPWMHNSTTVVGKGEIKCDQSSSIWLNVCVDKQRTDGSWQNKACNEGRFSGEGPFAVWTYVNCINANTRNYRTWVWTEVRNLGDISGFSGVSALPCGS
jgi:hypothetical protein